MNYLLSADRFLKGVLTVLLSWPLMALPSWSFQLLPISQEFSPRGHQATRAYQLKNTKDKAIAIELSVVPRTVDADGNETRGVESDDFILYPSQIILGPKQQQTVRVTWIGEENPPQELSYRLLAKELPIELEASGDVPANNGEIRAKIELLFSYAGSVYIRPSHAKANVVVKDLQTIKLPDGQTGLEIYLKNQGESRQLLTSPQIRLSAAGKSVLLEGEALSAINRRTILADGERRFTIPWPADLPQGQVTGELLVN